MNEKIEFDLVERYIYAVTKRMPGKMKKDVALELRTLISDMLEERCGEIVPVEKDVKVVLTELGTPQELFEQYSNDTKTCLIGPPYYTTYKFVMKIVWISAAFGLTLASFLGDAVGQGSFVWYEVLLHWMGTLWSGLVFAFAIVTGLFAFFYHKSIPIESYSGLESLPPVPKKNEGISKAECIFGMILSVLFVIIFLVCPQIFGAVTKEGEWIPFFRPDMLRNTWYIVIALGILGIFSEIIKLLDGKYTKRVVVTTIVTDLLSAVLSVWWIMGRNLFNSEFFIKIGSYMTEENGIVQSFFLKTDSFLAGIILLAILLDIIVTVVHGLQYNSK